MSGKEYFVRYREYSNWIDAVFKVVGETPKYYKIKLMGKTAVEPKILCVSKDSHYLKGTDIHLYSLPLEEIARICLRQKALELTSKTNFSKLTDSQLERIKKILEESNG